MRSPRAGSEGSALRWRIADPDPLCEVLARRLELPSVLVQVLLRRGCRTEEAIRAFLRADLEDLPDPEQIPGMAQAASRVEEAVARGDPIVVYGDYDADGVCACAILVRGLRGLGASVIPYIPHRLQEGYGLSAQAVERIAAGGARLLVAVDCGIAAVEEVALARRLGMGVVVVDHHEPPPLLPDADALVDPKLVGTGFREYCAAGLAWMLMRLLWSRRGMGRTGELLELAAIGTLADVVPLVGPNRILAKVGLARMPTSPLPGLQALLRVAGLSDRVTADDVVWRLAPRLNASGRLQSARLSLELLLTEDPEEAGRLSAELEALNQRRQRLQEEVVEAAVRAARSLDPGSRATLVLWGEWHPGVLGIAAGKVREAFYRPTVLLSVEGGRARGSGRSVPEVNLVEALRACAPLLEAFGGHAQAAGLSLPVEHLEAFRERFEEAVRSRIRPEDLVPTLDLDAELSLAELDDRLVQALLSLEPHGVGNPRPLFSLRGLQVVDSRLVGNDAAHLQLWLLQGTRRVEAIAFGLGERAEPLALSAPRVDVAASVEPTPWPDRGGVRLLIQDLRLARTCPETERVLERLFGRASEYWEPDRWGWVRSRSFELEIPCAVGTPDLADGRVLRFHREPDHPLDPYAVRLNLEDGRSLGFLPPEVAGQIAPDLDRGGSYRAVVVEAGSDRVRIRVEREVGESGSEGENALESRLLQGERLVDRARRWLDATRQGKGALVGGPGRGLWKVLLVGIAEEACRGRRVVCVWPTHDLADARWRQWGPKLWACGIRVTCMHGMFREPGTAQAPVVFTTFSYLSRHPDLLTPQDVLVGESLLLPEMALRHLGPVRWNLWSTHAEPPPGWVSEYGGGARLEVTLDDCRGRRGADLIEDLVGFGERVVVFEASPQEAVRTAEVLQARFPEVGIAYDHPFLPQPLRVGLHALLSLRRLQVLVCVGPPPEEGSARADHVVWRVPQPRALFLLQAACAASGRERVTLHLAFDAEDGRRVREAWEEAYPSRKTLARAYRRLRAGVRPVTSAESLPAALAILAELGVVEEVGGEWRVCPGQKRADLAASDRFLEGEEIRRALEQGIRWMRRAGAVEVLEAVAGPAVPPVG
ncbi:MAG: single-stranded-DNA-specific exonuclease RecJ [Armatimonadota bacterium]|nr:single-stranded-DNA-specific exonuclease RecJ [Armatimonadota bacterium]MDR7443761.1 single-stranded-DNA-specific exonuclease RecJ [Armatimonadota bacterium]MDR7613958.1 single-stranded-DNA-specific exonuclease RecJ [Armatimonadota bacterium]